MKKAAVLLSFLLIMCPLFSCGGPECDIALITMADGAESNVFSSLAWEAVSEYAEKNSLKSKYYSPLSNSQTDIAAAVSLAAENGAKVIVFPSRFFENHVHKAQSEYPQIKFILIDGIPNNMTSEGITYDGAEYNETITENTFAVRFNESQAGFLTGYSLVRDGHKNLGFIGGNPDATVKRYGYGFLQGAEYAANELKLKKGTVKIKYFYTGQSKATAETQKRAQSWFAGGTEVVFACGGTVEDSVIAAASAAQTKVAAADADQSYKSSAVITSAAKNVRQTVYDAVSAAFSETFAGGQCVMLGAETNSIGLPLGSSRFQFFTQEEYVAVFKLLAENDKSIDIKDEKTTDISKLGLKLITVTEEK